MRLILVRHAIAEDIAAGERGTKRDRDRRLTDKGMKRMRRAANGLRRLLDGEPPAIGTSPYLRALQTAQIIADSFRNARQSPLVQLQFLKPGSDPQSLIDSLSHYGPDNQLLLVGHEPDMSSLMAFLTCNERQSYSHFGKGGACMIEFDGPPAAGNGVLLWFATPSMLRRIGV